MRERLLEVLRALPADRKLEERGGSAWIVCPNPEHAGGHESTGSFKITLDGPYAGSVFCFGCKAKGNWAVGAAMLGLKGNAKFLCESAASDSFTDEDEDRMLGRRSRIEKPTQMAEPWPRSIDWRTVPGSVVSAVGGRMIVAGDGREPLLELPVSIHGREVGSVKCRVRKVEGQLSYINEKAKGNGWSKDALFPFDYVESLEPDVVTIVEGPRDALVNIANGLPSLATLGSTAWSAKCASLVKSLAPKMLLIMADPDGAGDQLVSKVYADLSDFMHVIRINLPFHMEERGGKQVKVKDLDPANLNRRMLRKILDRAGVPRTYLPDLFRVRIAS